MCCNSRDSAHSNGCATAARFACCVLFILHMPGLLLLGWQSKGVELTHTIILGRSDKRLGALVFSAVVWPVQCPFPDPSEHS